MLANGHCHNCGAAGVDIFYEQSAIPVHSCLLMPTRQTALAYPTGELRLGFCVACGFISNTRFDPNLNDYSASYEETQGFSAHFSGYAADLARRLIERYDLRGKTVLEIGCGKGEFLARLCESGGNSGIGIDPAYVPGRLDSSALPRLRFIRELFSDRHRELVAEADFICCRHSLEHIQPTLDFLSAIRRCLGGDREVTIFFDVPDVLRVLHERAFWDIYYEHCSYFSAGSLARLFRRAGFDILDLRREYDDQYLVIEARPCPITTSRRLSLEFDFEELRTNVAAFRDGVKGHIEDWRRMLTLIRRRNQKAVLWGSGSKATAFLTTLGITDELDYVVDINPYKHNRYLAGCGHQIIAPSTLRAYRPDMVIAMNPVYCPEIQRELHKLDVAAQLMTVTDPAVELSHA